MTIINRHRAEMEKTTKKDKPTKRPLGRRPAGAVLVDGRWELTELSTQLAAERLLRQRQARRTTWRKMQDRLRAAYPELFVERGLNPRQTTLGPRSTEREVDSSPCQKTDTSSNTYDAFWRSVQRDEDGAPNLPSGSASL